MAERYQSNVRHFLTPDPQQRIRDLETALTVLLSHCDMKPVGETAFERAVIDARGVLRGARPTSGDHT